MRIVIDMQGAQGASRERGIGRYTRSMVREFLRHAANHDVFLLFNGMLPGQQELCDELHGDFKPGNQRVWFAQSPFDNLDPANAARRELAEIVWEATVRSLQPDWVLLTSIFEGLGDDAVALVPADRDFRVAVILYDLIPLLYHENYLNSEAHKHHYTRQLRFLSQCDLLMAISDTSAEDARRLIKFPARHIVTIGAAIDKDFGAAVPIEADLPTQLNRPFLLYVSGGDVRKNHKNLIAAFAGIEQAFRSNYQLVIAGSFPATTLTDFQQYACDAGLADDEIVFAVNIDDQQLRRLYAECHSFVFPSWYEGFGMPVLEAMAFGKAVVGSDCSSIPDIIRDPEALFDPHDEVEIRKALVRLLGDQEFRSKLERQARKTIARYTWRDVAQRSLEALGSANWELHDPVKSAAAEAIAAIRSSAILDQISPEQVGSILARTFRPDPRRQLLLDVSELIHRDAGTGIQRVVRAVLRSLMANVPEGWRIEPVYAFPGEPGFRYARAFTDRLNGLSIPWHSDNPVEIWPGDVFCALDLNHGVLLAHQGLLADWRRQGVAVWTVVYDILPLQFPHFFSLGLDALHAAWLRCLAGFDGALCISRSVAYDLRAWIASEQVPASKHFRIEWFHLGADIQESAPSMGLPKDASELLSHLVKRPSVLMVGTVEPRKGHRQALDAFDRLWNAGQDVNLVIVGKDGWDVEELVDRLRRHRELGKRLFWLNGVSDEFLDQVYNSSDLLLAASEGEGFGLPLIEAAQKGIPLLVRDIPVFREVAGDAADYFANSTDATVLAEALGTWVKRRGKAATKNSNSMKWLTWDQSASQFFNKLIN
ncbi:glycosyltransferase family 1 protein [Sphingorhabdus sp.]|uniref:glycosyltransferase family 4 protein n=1 Tax=Sphingorhabdus sp. TaxID=1902408 RepID=UPI003342185B